MGKKFNFPAELSSVERTRTFLNFVKTWRIDPVCKHVTCTNSMQHLLFRKHAVATLLQLVFYCTPLIPNLPIPLRSGPKFAVDLGIVVQCQTYCLETNETGPTLALSKGFKRFRKGSEGFERFRKVSKWRLGGNSGNSARVLQHEGRHSDFAAVLLQSIFLIRPRIRRNIDQKIARLSKSDPEKCGKSLPTNA